MPRKVRRRSPTSPLPLAAPGAFGLNTELKTQVADPRWALVLQNGTWNDAGRLTLRKGYVSQTSTAMAGGALAVHVLHEYLKKDDTRSLIGAVSREGAESSFTSEVSSFSPVIEYRFDEASGDLLNHGSAGSSYDMEALGSPTYEVANGDNAGGSAISFSGGSSDDGFVDNTTTAYESITSGAIIVAFKCGTDARGDTIFNGVNASNGFSSVKMVVESDGKFSCETLDSGGTAQFKRFSTSAIDDDEYHVVVIVQRADGNGFELWIDGAEDTGGSTSGSAFDQWFDDVAPGWTWIGLGIRPGSNGTFGIQEFAGEIDYFVVTATELSEEQIEQLSSSYESGVPGGALWESTDDGDTWTDVSGSISSTSAKWVFRNFNDDVYATAPGQRVWRYTGSGTFTEIADSPVTNGTLLAAFGRLWVGVDASTQVKYSGLLDGTDWTSASSGTIDAENAFAQGTDQITALAAFGATLVVFARRQFLMYVDGAGSELAVSPDNLYVVDSVEGTGALEQDTVINIGEGDLWFRSEQGIQSLSRVVQDKVNPKTDISRHVRSLVQDLADSETGADGTVKAVYDPRRQFALFLYPTSEKVVLFDTRAPLDDGTYRSLEWTSQPFFSLCRRKNGDLLFGLDGGEVAKYTGYRDAGSTAFDLVFATPWTDGGDDNHNRLKMLKGLYLDVFGRETLTAKFRWAFDYRPLEFSADFTSDYASSGGEYGAGEFGEAEFGDGHRSRREKVGAGGQGRVFKVWLTIESTDVDDFLSIQEVGAYVKLGRFE